VFVKVSSRLPIVVSAALVAGVGAARLALDRSFVPYQTAGAPVALLVGWSFVGSGLVVWRQRSENRLGPVMVLTGFAWFASFLTDASQPLLFTAGTLVQSVYLVGFAYVILSFPSGRLQSRPERLVIAAAIGLTTPVELAAMTVARSPSVLCSGCPRNVLEVTRSDMLANGILQGQRIAAVGVTAMTLMLLVRRWRAASGPHRRGVAPVLWCGAATLVALAVSIGNDVGGGPLGQAPKWVLFLSLATLPIAVMSVLLHRRLARGAVAGLVVELGVRGAGTDLRAALARALADPSLQLAYWFPERARYVDGDGRPVELPGAGDDREVTVVERGGQPIAAVIHDAALLDNAELVDSVCAAAALSIENERLQAELRARVVELQASRARLVEATEDERRRIERDLHDGTQQRLVSIAMSLGLLDAKLPLDAAEAKPLVREARMALSQALADLRDLTQGIYPTVLSERGLRAALDELCRQSALPALVECTLVERLPSAIETAAYFIVSEAITNAAKHSHATEVTAVVTYADRVLRIEVADDGIGGARPSGGTGLRGLTDRAEALGGTLTLTSPPGRGTRLRVRLPCE
jgi:signal transduction histidine kinase